MNNVTKLLVGNSVLLAIYYISAHFTLSLGLPPIGGTPVWIPAGISLAAILIWGYGLLPAIFIGDFVIGAELVGLNDTTSVLICILIGAQAAGHAWLATWLLHRLKLWPNPLTKEINIFKFFLITAGLSLFVTTLAFGMAEVALGVLTPEQLLSTLFLWWAGGAIGVVVFTPLVLILFAKPRQEWKLRIYSVLVPLVLIFTILIVMLFSSRQYEQKIRAEAFDENTTVIHKIIEGELAKNKLLLKAMRAHFRNSESVSSAQFIGYMNDLSDYQGSIEGVAWIDYVPHQQRQEYEQNHGQNILELDDSGVPHIAKMRSDYLVIKYSRVENNYLSSLDNRSDMNMFNICFNPERRSICHEVIVTQQAMILPPILGRFEDSKRFVSILPVMSEDKELIGLVGHMYDYQSLFNVILQSPVKQWLNLTITDITEVNSPHIIYNYQEEQRKVDIVGNLQLLNTKVIEIGGRTWQLMYQPSQHFLSIYSNWSLYIIMTSALIILSLISIFLLSMTGRVRQVEQEVVDKTKQIKASEHKFRQLIEGVKDEYILFTHDREGVFTYVSPSVENVLGYSCEEFLCQYSTFMPDTPLNKLVDDYTRRTIQGERVTPYELEILHKNGNVHTLKISENATKNDEGRIVGVEGVAQDVTQSKREHMQLEKLSLAVEHSPNAVVITNKKGLIEYVNPRFTEITGYSLLEVMDKWPSVLKSGNTPNSTYKELWETLLSGHEWRGELQNRKKNGDIYWAREHICPLFDSAGNVTHFVATQEDVTEAKRLSEETSYQASHDLLTGLINRREFEFRLDRVIKSAKVDSGEHALCFMDLDQFKVINDTCGHVAGDELLRQVGDLLLSNVRQRDTLARLGGDEFALLMEHCGIEQAYDACQKMIDVLADFRFHWEDHVFTVGVSIGMAVIDLHVKDSIEALSRVDGACYAAKDAGRNRVEVYTEDSERLHKRKGEIQWSSEISDALDNDRFVLYAQPIIPLQQQDSGASYEVLLRLKMRDDSIVPPGAFLPAAERYNSATRIDRWVVTHTLRWVSKHAASLKHVNSISINLSGQSLGDDGMLGFIIREFQQGDVPTEKIKFEITETAAIANLRDATVFIKTLSELGCRFALDDFGSGLSSFAYLKNLQVSVLKIDGMFVKDMLSDPIDFEMVKSINDIGHVMGLETIAEFVENDDVADKLREIGVDYAQGYALGEPAPIETILQHD